MSLAINMSYFRPSSRQWTVRHLRRPSRHRGLRVSSRRNKEELCRALNRHFNPQNIGTVLSYDASLESIEEYGAIVEIIPTRDRPRRRRRRAVLSPPTESGTALYCDGCTDPLQLTEMPRTHCGHTFNMCIGCISQWVASERTSKRPGDIRCLADECTAALVYEDIEAYVPEDEKQRTLVQFLTEAIGGFSYPTPGCGTQIFADERLSYAQCNACQRRACVECHTEWHTGITCNEYQDQQHKKAAQDDEKSEEFKRANYQHCPKCQTWIEKIAGCDHMTCGNSMKPFKVLASLKCTDF